MKKLIPISLTAMLLAGLSGCAQDRMMNHDSMMGNMPMNDGMSMKMKMDMKMMDTNSD